MYNISSSSFSKTTNPKAVSRSMTMMKLMWKWLALRWLPRSLNLQMN